MRFSDYISLLEVATAIPKTEIGVEEAFEGITHYLRSLPYIHNVQHYRGTSTVKVSYRIAEREVDVLVFTNERSSYPHVVVNVDFNWIPKSSPLPSEKDSSIFAVSRHLELGSLELMQWFKRVAVSLAAYPVVIKFSPTASRGGINRRDHLYEKIMRSSGYVPISKHNISFNERLWAPQWFSGEVDAV